LDENANQLAQSARHRAQVCGAGAKIATAMTKINDLPCSDLKPAEAAFSRSIHLHTIDSGADETARNSKLTPINLRSVAEILLQFDLNIGDR
jgi:hypothetical protein